MRQNSNAAVGKPGPLPANLDEMKVSAGAAGSPGKLHGPFFFWPLSLEESTLSGVAAVTEKGWRCCPAVRASGAGPLPVVLVIACAVLMLPSFPLIRWQS